MKCSCILLVFTALSQVHHPQCLRRDTTTDEWGWARNAWNSAKGRAAKRAEGVSDFVSHMIGRRLPSRVRTLKDVTNTCPGYTHELVDKVFDMIQGARNVKPPWYLSTLGRVSDLLLGKPDDVDRVAQGMNDKADLIMYHALIQTMKIYSTRNSSSVLIPSIMGNGDVLELGDVVAPMHDIDSGPPPRTWLVVPDYNCMMEVLRDQPIIDDLVDNTVADRNTWQGKLKETGGRHKDKREYMSHYFNKYHQASGESVWPTLEIDLRQLYYYNNAWADDAEKTLAFDLIGSHRIERTSKAFGGETLTWVVRLNDFATLAVRKGFGKWGADMYFTEDGMPALIITPDGKEISRSDSDWQYWKFVWRSTLITGVTLIDHLHMAHFRTANVYARVVREALPPAHPFRRFMTIFTFGTIDVNINAMHTLIGPQMTLHRCVPFKDFYTFASVVPDQLHDPVVQHKQFMNDTEWDTLPDKLKRLPYFEDGRPLFAAIRRLVINFEKEYLKVCDGNGTLDQGLKRFQDVLFQYTVEGDYKGMQRDESLCSVIRNRIPAFIWSVTGWHRHVGQVVEYKDPDLASPSWKDGEPFGRPKQYFSWAMIAVQTAKIQPKLSEDYTHLFNKMKNGERAKAIWREFQQDLKQVKETVASNNRNRVIKNFHADPDIVECSLAV